MKRCAKWKAAVGIILTTMLTLMLLTIIYWLFVEADREELQPGVGYGGDDLWWNVLASSADQALYLLVECVGRR